MYFVISSFSLIFPEILYSLESNFKNFYGSRNLTVRCIALFLGVLMLGGGAYRFQHTEE